MTKKQSRQEIGEKIYEIRILADESFERLRMVSKKQAHEEGLCHQHVQVFLFRYNYEAARSWQKEIEVAVPVRAPIVQHNAGLMDKSVGGHVTAGVSIDSVVQKETWEECAVQSRIVESFDALESLILDGATHQDIASVVHLGDRPYTSRRVISGTDYRTSEQVMLHVFMGLYNGRMFEYPNQLKEFNKEVEKVKWMSILDLNNSINSDSRKREEDRLFTSDMKYLLDVYLPIMTPYLKRVCQTMRTQHTKLKYKLPNEEVNPAYE